MYTWVYIGVGAQLIYSNESQKRVPPKKKKKKKILVHYEENLLDILGVYFSPRRGILSYKSEKNYIVLIMDCVIYSI